MMCTICVAFVEEAAISPFGFEVVGETAMRMCAARLTCLCMHVVWNNNWLNDLNDFYMNS